MLNDLPNDFYRHLIENAIDTGRFFQSKQTGMLHFCHSDPHAIRHDLIPIYENALFALALFRSKSIENIKEGQTLIERLIAFQSASGNFPVYLTDFPTSKDFLMAVQVWGPLYLIFKHFGHVISHDCRQLLSDCLKKIAVYCIDTYQKTPFPYTLALRTACLLRVTGQLLNESYWMEEGAKLLSLMPQEIPEQCLSITKYLGDLLLCCQLIGDESPSLFPKETKEQITNMWHSGLSTYAGPHIREQTDKNEPALNLYAFYMSALFQKSSPPIRKESIDYLQAALVYPISFSPQENPLSTVRGSYKTQSWTTFNTSTTSLNLLQKQIPQPDGKGAVYSPLTFQWAERIDQTESGKTTEMHGSKSGYFTCQNCPETVDYHVQNPESIWLDFTLEHPFDKGSAEKSREINFFVNLSSAIKILVDEKPATTFELGKTVTFLQGEKKVLDLRLELIEGSGDFFGHIALSNRPSQKNQGVEKRFAAWDWIIFLKTLRRSDVCLIRAYFQFY